MTERITHDGVCRQQGGRLSRGGVCNALLLAVMLAALLVVGALYWYLNRTAVAEVAPFQQGGARLEHYIDACEVTDGKAYIAGWMLLRDQDQNSLIEAYVENHGGQWVALNTRLKEKKAAYHKFGLSYAKGKVGFSAAGRVSNVAKGARFLVVKRVSDNEAYGMYHACP